MAAFNDITVKKELRLCKVGKEFGYFHCWEQYSEVIEPEIRRASHSGGQYLRLFGIVEFEDGIERVTPEKIKFVDETNAFLAKMNKVELLGDYVKEQKEIKDEQ